MTPEQCYEKAAQALEHRQIDKADEWRRLGDSLAGWIATKRREGL